MDTRAYFELTYLPKHTKAVKRFQEMLSYKERFEKEVSNILAHNKIKPTSVDLKLEKKGKGKKDSLFEGFEYRKYLAKIKGIKKSFWSEQDWNAQFNLYLLYGRKRDGLLFRALVDNGKDVKAVAEGIYYKLLMNAAHMQGAVPWSNIIRTKTF